MKRLTYVGRSVLTNDELAALLLEYSQALALEESSDVVSFPAITENGEIGEVQLLVGPSSQLIVEPAVSHLSLDTEEALAELQSRFDALTPPPVRPGLSTPDPAIADYDLPMLSRMPSEE